MNFKAKNILSLHTNFKAKNILSLHTNFKAKNILSLHTNFKAKNILSLVGTAERRYAGMQDVCWALKLSGRILSGQPIVQAYSHDLACLSMQPGGQLNTQLTYKNLN
jgi:hypothetical protein